VSLTDASNCIWTSQVPVTQPADLFITVESSRDVLCFGAQDGRVDITVNGGVAPYLFEWSNGDSGEDLVGAAAGSYSLTVTDSTGCEAVFATNVSQPFPLEAVLTATDASCFGEEDGQVSAVVSGGTPPYTLIWPGFSNDPILTGLGAGTYTLLAEDANGCRIFESAFVDQPDEILSDAYTDKPDFTVVYGYPVLLGVNVDPPSNYIFNWSPVETIDDPSLQVATARPLAFTTFLIEVEDINTGCGAIDSVSIQVEFPQDLGIPNAFSPNGDGNNETFFEILQLNIELLELQIFNRWGEVVYAGLGPWDGTFKGQPLNPGTFVYLMKFRNKISDETFERYGSVALIR